MRHILLEGGLPVDYDIENISKNDKNGQLVIDNLDSSVCLNLTSHIHGNKFFNRKVFVTSVVQKTPEKAAEVEELEPCPNNLEQSSGSDTSSDESDAEQSLTASKPPRTKLFSSISVRGKRSAKSSPEVSSETSKRDKKKTKQDNAAATNLRSSSR